MRIIILLVDKKVAEFRPRSFPDVTFPEGGTGTKNYYYRNYSGQKKRTPKHGENPKTPGFLARDGN
jgi:hypothetical protein